MHSYGENVEKLFSQNVLKTKGWKLQSKLKQYNFLVTIKI